MTLNAREWLIIIANGTIIFSFTLGFFFNSATPTYYPAGTPVPATTSCDLLSSVTHLCFPSIAIPITVGTIVLNVDVVISILTTVSLFFGLIVLNKEIPG